MIDQSKEFIVKMLSGGEKICRVRFPREEESCGAARRVLVVGERVPGDSDLSPAAA